MQTYYRNNSYQKALRLAPARQKKRLFYLKASRIALAVTVGVGLILIMKNTLFNGNDGTGQSQNLAAATDNNSPPETQEPPKRQIDTSTLQASLSQIIKRYPYDTSVSVIDLNSGTLIQTGDNYPFIAASTTKLLTALFYLNNVETGQTGLDTQINGKPARDQLQLALKESDNNAWRQLNDYLGKDRLLGYAQAHGYKSYDPANNTITSNDMAQIMADLYTRKLLNDENTKLLLSSMQNTSEERFIPSAVPEGMAIYHKAGYLAERVHDVAVIDNGSAPFVLVIYSKSYTASYDYLIGQKLFNQVTEQAIATFK